ncbi:alcohol dehydrogenase catalytic domain-containing protein [Rhodococcoides fascians]|uniref:alcohol dehydrogenase catalytic domain-containing protein n=1 Tax=Rhodococcoides fascians TaxID=1828 RepID=UPI0006910F1F|nr:alcohol dehydrogenase catalytic domain-containing protein [Rhodococcus fascians]
MSAVRPDQIDARAAIVRSAGADLQVESVQLRAVGPHEVLVKNKASGLCHTDLSVSKGELGLPLPIVPGHEGAGIVVACGDQVTLVEEGDHVITAMMPECGRCRSCLSGRTNACVTMAELGNNPVFHQAEDLLPSMAFGSTFATHAIVPETTLAVIPDDVPFEVAALFGCGVSTGVGAVRNTAHVEAGSTVVVFGLGLIGLNVVQASRSAGAARIIALDGLPERRSLAARFGATDVLDPAQLPNVVSYLLDVTGGGADYVFECVGKASVLREATSISHQFGGVCIAVGAVPFGDTISFPGGTFLTGRALLGTFIGNIKPRSGLPILVKDYKEGRLALDEFVTARISLDEINDGLRMLEAGTGIRTVLVHD